MTRGRGRSNSFTPRGRGRGGPPRHGPARDIQCSNCGYSHQPGQCPAYGRQCRKCRRFGHFQSQCRSQHAAKVDSMTQNDMHGEDDSPEYFLIDTVRNEGKDWVAPLCFGDVSIDFKLDTGAQCNVMPLEVYNRISTEPLLPSTACLESYTKSQIVPQGKAVLPVTVKDVTHQVTFQVVHGDYAPLLGRSSCEALQLIARVDAVGLSVLDSFPKLFEGLGCLPGQYRITVDPAVSPVVHAPRRIPHAQRSKLQSELDSMIKKGIIEKVPVNEPADWVSSLVCVDKPDGSVRVCLDPQDLNKAIKREHYPLPTVEEIAAKCTGARFFTTLDASKAFFQVQLDSESSKLLTFNTPFGRHRYLRMPMGILSAPEVYQHRMELVVEGLEGVAVMMDDILVYGQSEEDHDAHLKQVLQRCQTNNLTLNRHKCQVKQQSVKFLGHTFTDRGLQPDPAKVAAITSLPTPTDRAGVYRLMGMVNYVSKFVPNLSSLSEPLRVLLCNETQWHWEKPQEDAFQAICKVLTEAPVLAYYNPAKALTLQVDASSTGVGAAMVQEGHPVAYASKSFTPTQCRYAQIEKEMLAVVFGCNKFREYVIGRDVLIETDHKPLEAIFKKPFHAAPVRLQRMLVQMLHYPGVRLVYKRGAEMFFADALSRAHLDEQLKNGEVLDIHTLSGVITDAQLGRFQEATAKDPVLQALQATVLDGWPDQLQGVHSDIQCYWNFRDEISVCDGLLVKGSKVIVPKSLRPEMLEKLHDGHMGISSTISRARTSLFWPRMSSDITDWIQSCSVCQRHQPSLAAEPMMAHEIPKLPWAKVGTDLFYKDGVTYIIVVDYYSKYPEITKLPSSTSSSAIAALKTQFARFGVPSLVVSDNGPCFSSTEFQQFATQWQFQHITSSPGHPKSNGQAERMVQTVKAMLLKSADPYKALLSYRTTPLAGVQLSPAELLMGRQLRTLVPAASELLAPAYHDPLVVHPRLVARQNSQKSYHDRSSHALPDLHVGDPVYVQEGKVWTEGTVTGYRQEPRSYEVQVAGNTYRRNRCRLRLRRDPMPDVQSSAKGEQQQEQSYVTRSGRLVKKKLPEDA